MVSELQTLILDNKYEILTLLRTGNMGTVYLVRRKTDGKKLVVKKLIFSSKTGLEEKDIKEIFSREVEFLSRFDHPGLPRVYGTFRQGKDDYLVLEYIKGRTLEEILHNSGNYVSVDRALRWAIEIAEILDYLHNSFEAPIVYKDLKPSNIIINPLDNPRLIDFGTSRYYNPDKDSDTHRLGTPGYAAPEQYRGQSTAQSDVFSLGVILFQMLTGYDPTVAPLKFPSMRALNPFIHSDLEAIVGRAIEKDPFRRYISVMEFKENLEKYIRTEELKYSAYFPATTSSSAQSTSLTGFFRGLKNKTLESPLWGVFNHLYFTVFARRFASMINTGVPLGPCLDDLRYETEDKKLEKALVDLRKDVYNGSTLSDALTKSSGLFSPVFRSVVKAGEDNKDPGFILKRFASLLEADYKVQRTLRWVTVYTFIIVAIFSVMGYILFGEILPTFVDLFEGMDLTLPLSTKILIRFTKAIRNPFIMFPIILFLIISTIVFKKLVRTATGKKLYDRFKLLIPLAGSVNKKILTFRFCHTLATLVSIDVPLAEALELAGKSSCNDFLAQKIVDAREIMERCETITPLLAGTGIFPPMVIEMMEKGEECDTLDDMLYRISDTYNKEVELILEKINRVEAIVITVATCIIVAYIIIALFAPMYTIGGTIK